MNIVMDHLSLFLFLFYHKERREAVSSLHADISTLGISKAVVPLTKFSLQAPDRSGCSSIASVGLCLHKRSFLHAELALQNNCCLKPASSCPGARAPRRARLHSHSCNGRALLVWDALSRHSLYSEHIPFRMFLSASGFDSGARMPSASSAVTRCPGRAC